MSQLIATLYGIKPEFSGQKFIHMPESDEEIDPEFDHLELSDEDFAAIHPGQKRHNRTCKADNRYLDALQNGNLTTK